MQIESILRLKSLFACKFTNNYRNRKNNYHLNTIIVMVRDSSGETISVTNQKASSV